MLACFVKNRFSYTLSIGVKLCGIWFCDADACDGWDDAVESKDKSTIKKVKVKTTIIMVILKIISIMLMIHNTNNVTRGTMNITISILIVITIILFFITMIIKKIQKIQIPTDFLVFCFQDHAEFSVLLDLNRSWLPLRNAAVKVSWQPPYFTCINIEWYFHLSHHWYLDFTWWL